MNGITRATILSGLMFFASTAELITLALLGSILGMVVESRHIFVGGKDYGLV